MIRGMKLADDDVMDADDKAGQCCLKAAHFCASFLILFTASCVVFILSLTKPDLSPFQTPAAAVMVLSLVLVAVTGSIAIFVELRLQERYPICEAFHKVVCCTSGDSELRINDNSWNMKKKSPSYDTRTPSGELARDSEPIYETSRVIDV